ncbi:hypothetical protein DXG01_016693 [Tephrocybe rancida]|nr:hypothetical protein DXG01_016693 [Tephrocybe rancida]
MQVTPHRAYVHAIGHMCGLSGICACYQAYVRAAHTAIPDDGDVADDEKDELFAADTANEQCKKDQIEEQPEESSDEYVELVVYENNFYTSGDDQDHLFALTECPSSFVQGDVLLGRVQMHKVKVLASKEALKQPILAAEDKECLVTWVTVNGQQAWMLWDSGSTTSSLTPVFAHVAGLRVSPLENPIVLQLGTIGSRSVVNFGAEVPMQVPGFEGKVYVDIANFDRYDLIIGTPFMRQGKVHLDFENNLVVVNGVPHQAE